MNDQGQHRIPQIYLKQFGFRDKNNKWMISTWKLGEEYTNNISIKHFTKEKNIFDLHLEHLHIEDKRFFENLCANIETHYPKVINDITKTKKLSPNNLMTLAQFMMSILCRTHRFRNMIDGFLKSNKRDYFLSEITFYDDDKGQTLLKNLANIKIDDQLNFVIYPVWLYFTTKITSSNFDYVILKDNNNEGWITTDNPVVMINSINQYTLLSEKTEIYFPISKQFCLYVDHMDYNRSNILRGNNNEELVEIDENIQKKIADLIWRQAYEYVIFPANYGRRKLS